MIEKPTFNDEYKQGIWESVAYTTFGRKDNKPFRRNQVYVDPVVKASLANAPSSYSITTKILIRFIQETGERPSKEWLEKLKVWIQAEQDKEWEHLQEVWNDLS